MSRQRTERINSSKIVTIEAPIAAINRLMRERPEVIRHIAQRYSFEYSRILEEEKERLLAQRAAYLEKVRRWHREKKKKTDDSPS